MRFDVNILNCKVIVRLRFKCIMVDIKKKIIELNVVLFNKRYKNFISKCLLNYLSCN